MTSYEIFILLMGFFGALTAISVISAVLNEGSARATAILAALTAIFFWLASRASEEGVVIQDISPAINKLLNMFLG